MGSQKKHLRFKGIRPRTASLYRREVARFFEYLSTENIAIPNDPEELDLHVAEFINMLYQEGDSLSHAGWLLSGLKRFMPQLKRSLATSQQWYNNWARDHQPVRAVPMPWTVARTLSFLAWEAGRIDVSLCILLGFSFYLRSMEMLSLDLDDLVVDSRRSAVFLSLKSSKTSRGRQQSLVFHNALLAKIVQIAKNRLGSQGMVWTYGPGCFRRAFEALIHNVDLQRFGFSFYSFEGGALRTPMSKATTWTKSPYVADGKIIEQLVFTLTMLRQTSFVCNFHQVSPILQQKLAISGRLSSSYANLTPKWAGWCGNGECFFGDAWAGWGLLWEGPPTGGAFLGFGFLGVPLFLPPVLIQTDASVLQECFVLLAPTLRTARLRWFKTGALLNKLSACVDQGRSMNDGLCVYLFGSLVLTLPPHPLKAGCWGLLWEGPPTGGAFLGFGFLGVPLFLPPVLIQTDESVLQECFVLLAPTLRTARLRWFKTGALLKYIYISILIFFDEIDEWRGIDQWID